MLSTGTLVAMLISPFFG